MRLFRLRRLLMCAAFFSLPAVAFAQAPRGYCALHAATRNTVTRNGAANSDGASAANADSSAEHGFPLTNLDRSVPACTNFFQYAVGGWLKSNPIPAAYSSWGIDSVMSNENEATLHKIQIGRASCRERV